MKKTLTTIFLTACALCASATDYYVSPDGAGTKDGTSWENAWSIDEFKTQFNAGNAATYQNGDNFYFAPGKYTAATTFYIKMGINLIGAEGPERTVFSGDLDGNGKVNSGDRDRFLNINTEVTAGTTEKCVTITNIDFDGFYINQGGSDSKGAIYLDNCGAQVTVSKCNFTNLINTGQGANAFFSKRSSLKVIDCTFTGNKAANRGVVARLQSDDSSKGYTIFERCLFADNEATGSTSDPCGLVMMQHGQKMTFTCCTFINNKINGIGACIWDNLEKETKFKRELEVTSCLFYNNSSADNKNILVNANNTYTESGNVNHECGSGISAAINISSVGVGTYYLSLPFAMPAGVTGKTFSSIAGTRLTEGKIYEAGNVVPAGTALLVEGAEGTYDPVVAEDDNSAPTNMLSGSDFGTTTTGEGKHYKLANGESGLAFYYGTAEGAPFSSAAHKAWLVVPTTDAARLFFSFFDDEATGVERVTKQAAPQDGKFMENGRMVILKNGVKYNAVGQKL